MVILKLSDLGPRLWWLIRNSAQWSIFEDGWCCRDKAIVTSQWALLLHYSCIVTSSWKYSSFTNQIYCDNTVNLWHHNEFVIEYCDVIMHCESRVSRVLPLHDTRRVLTFPLPESSGCMIVAHTNIDNCSSGLNIAPVFVCRRWPISKITQCKT